MCIKKTNALSKCRLVKFREVSDSVWVSFEAMIIEKTLKEEWANKNNFDDNYNYYSDTIDNYKLHFAEQRRFLIYLQKQLVVKFQRKYPTMIVGHDHPRFLFFDMDFVLCF